MSTDEIMALRRQFDEQQIQRFSEFGVAITRLQQAFEESLRNTAVIQANQTAMIERITAFNEKFLEHDEREGEDRVRIIAAINTMTQELSTHHSTLARHDEQVSTLKQWVLYGATAYGALATALAALATAGVAWIIQHLQSMPH